MNIDDLIAGSEFVGGIYDMNYESCKVHTTDYIKKVYCGGLQRHSFLIAQMDPENITTDLGDSGNSNLKPHALLLQVSGPAELPAEGELVGARYQNIEEKVVEEMEEGRDAFDIDAITREKIQKTAVEANLIGTFYEDDGEIEFGGDVHTVFPSGEYFVHKLTGDALEWVANYMRPHVEEKSPPKIDIGKVKYSASELREDDDEEVPVAINAQDLVGNKTALFGMTRTGKSNTMKILATAVHLSQDDVGQLIFDPSGEYGNPNEQDAGDQSEDYALIKVDDAMKRVGNDEEADISLKTNFFKGRNLGTARTQARQIIERRQLGDVSGYLQNFIDAEIRNPGDFNYDRFVGDDGGNEAFRQRAQDYKRLSAFYAVLIEAGLEADPDRTLTIIMGSEKREEFFDNIDRWEKGESDNSPAVKLEGNSVGNVYETDGNLWFHDLEAVSEFWKDIAALAESNETIAGWIDSDLRYILDVLVPEQDTYQGAAILSGLRDYHDPTAEAETEQRIYELLKQGNTVIIDLSDGNEQVNADRAERFIKLVLSESMNIFSDGETPPDIQIYLEEAHRYFDKERFNESESYDPYVRLAKEGAKYHIGLVYATQEVSSVDPRVLANTANWIVTHLNNSSEIGELTDYYDFEVYEDSILNVMERGFARTRFLSNEYTLPVRIEKFTEEWVEQIEGTQ